MSDKRRITPADLRSKAWFDNPHNPGMTALYLERYLNYGLTPEELRQSVRQVPTDLTRAEFITVPRDKNTYSVDPVFDIGGPVFKDKVWFFVAYRDKRSIQYTDQGVRSLNISPDPFKYVPDLTFRPVSDQVTKDSANRLTWQVSPKNRVSFFYDYNSKWEGNAGSGPFSSTEATYIQTYKSSIYQGTWSAPVTNRLLFDAGMSVTRIPRRQITKSIAQPPTTHHSRP